MPSGSRLSRLQFCVLGPLSVRTGGRALDLGPRKQRQVLAVLLCHANRAVTPEMLADALWDDRPPRTGRKNVQVYVSNLRKLLTGGSEDGGRWISYEHGGYVLRAVPGELDSLRFEELARAARQSAAAGAADSAAGLLRQALELWHGPLLSGLAETDVLRAEADRMALRRVGVYEDWAEAELQLGNPAAVLETVEELVAGHPFRERLRAAQMTALHQSGRQTEALAVYEEYRQSLARELGLEPGPALTARHRSLLASDRGATTPGSGRPAAVVTRSSLPRALPDFTGRTDLLDELCGLPGPGCSVALVGPAGSGKTALAVQAAHRLAKEFPDGRFFVRLRQEGGSVRPAPEVLAELCEAAGLTADAEAWRCWTAGRRVLLVLDDAPDEPSVRALLPHTEGCAVLVTARSRLAGLDATHRLDVLPLAMGEAVDLLERVAGPGRLATDQWAAERIATATGLLPLALRIAGTKLAVLRHLAPADYAARLSDPRWALDELASGDRAVRPRLAEAWADLPDPARSTVRRLSLLPTPFTLTRAATALGLPEPTARRVLESLVEACALTAPTATPDTAEVTAHIEHTPRVRHTELYELPPLTRLYAREQTERKATPELTAPA